MTAAVAVELGLYGLGNVLWSFGIEHLQNPPIPSICDGLWLIFYPLSYAGIVGFARVHGLRRLPAGVWLDAIIAGAGLAAGTDTSCLPTGCLSAEADRDADIGTTTTSSSAVPERSSSSDTMMAGRLFPRSPARAAPSETSQSSLRRGRERPTTC